MSSILKALQRLQGGRGTAGSPAPKPALQDQLARDLAAPPLLPRGQSPPESEPAPSRARLALLAVPVALSLAGVALGAYWLASGDEEPAAVVAPEAAAARPPAVAAAPVRPAPAPAAPAPRAAPAPATAPRPSPSPERARRTPPTVAAAPAPIAEPTAAPKPEPAPRRPAQRRATGEPPRFEVVAEATKAPAVVAPAVQEPDESPGALPGEPPAKAPAAKPPRPAGAEAKPEPAAAATEAYGAPTVLRTVWHPKPERRVARILLPDSETPIDVREGDAVASFVVKTIEPSGVLLLQNGREVRRTVGR